MRLLICTDSLNIPTGFARVGREIALGLQKRGHEIGYLGWFQHSDIPANQPEGIRCWFTNNQHYSADILDSVVNKFQPDVLLTIGDLWHLSYIADPNLCRTRRFFQWANYCSVDGEPLCGGLPPAIRPVIEDIDIPVAYTDYAKNAVLKSIFDQETRNRIRTIYHGVDTNMFKPGDKKKRQDIRAQYGITDKFVFLTVCRNQSRKNIPELFRAWKKFSELPQIKDRVILWPHMYFNDSMGWNIDDLLQVMDLKNQSIMYFDQIAHSGSEMLLLPNERLAELYQIADAFVLLCYTPETHVLTKSGGQQIKDIEIGTEVLSVDGHFNKVKEKYSRQYDGEIIEISPSYGMATRLTPEHVLFTLEKTSFKHQYLGRKMRIGKNVLIKKQAKDLKRGDILVSTRVKDTIKVEAIEFHRDSFVSNQFGKSKKLHPNVHSIKQVEVDSDLMYLFGLYLAEGCISQTNNVPEGIVFCINSNETILSDLILQIIKNKFGFNGTIKDDTRHRRTIRFWSVLLGEKFKELFGSGAHNKKMPEWFITLPIEQQTSLLKGLWDGDGHRALALSKYPISEYTTVSENLAWQVRTILIRLGHICSISKIQRQSMVYRVRMNHDLSTTKQKRSSGWIDDNYFYYPIRSIKKINYSGIVYDLQVENNHSYETSLCCGKNSGEGFGLPTFEAMATGLPCILLDHSASSELGAGGRAELVPIGGSLTWTGSHLTQRPVPDTEAAIKSFTKVFSEKPYRDSIAKAGHEFAIQYSWDRVLDEWQDLFLSREIPFLKPMKMEVVI